MPRAGFLLGDVIRRPATLTVLDLIAASVARVPHETAVIAPGRSVTYGELDALAETVCRDLRDHRVAAGALVPLLTAGGLGLPVAMVAVMKAGAAFVPVDIDWPARRRRYALDLLGPGVALVADGSPANPALRCVTLGEGARRPARDYGPAAGGRSPDSVIYGFFTSGSTGKPKCALNLHRGLVNRFLVMSERFGADGDVVLQNSSHIFDSSIWQLLWPLTRGRSVVLPERQGVLDFVGTLAASERHAVTMTDFVPTMLELLLELVVSRPARVAQLRSLKRLLVGGEAMNPETVQRFRTMLPGLAITNTYGPTEASIGSVFHDVTEDAGRAVPLGTPIANTAVVLLDDGGQPVSPGDLGQIHLAGLCVGAGYLGDPSGTREAFVANPFPAVPGETLYRTGDYGYLRDDGLLMFVGRRDDQIKLAGMRIDLPEVEAVLREEPGVRQVKALAYGVGPERRLACVVAGDVRATEARLLRRAQFALPAAMVPARILRLDRLPLLPNGKVDQLALRDQLGQAEHAPPALRQPPAAARATVRRMWSELLPEGARDGTSFLDSGGTSLGAVRLARELVRQFGVPVTARDVLTAGTATGLADLVVRDAAPSAGPWPADPRSRVLGDVVLELPLVAGPPAAGRHGGAGSGPDRGTVLVTGASGFVGIHLVAELQSQTPARILCLVRAGDDARAMARLRSAATAAGVRLDSARMAAVAGDLAERQLGLPAQRYAELAAEVGTIVHAGAMVNTIAGYEPHRGPNVLGTRNILLLAATGRPKRLWHLSTVSIFELDRGVPERSDGVPPPDRCAVPDGYSQSKWAAEQLVESARRSGLPVTVCRLGEVGAHSRTGAGNARSLVTLLLRLCHLLGARVPTAAAVDWTPVDLVARLICESIVGGVGEGETLHVLRPGRLHLSELMAGLAARRPYGLPALGYREFLDRGDRRVSDDRVARALATLPRRPRGEDAIAEIIRDAAAGLTAPRAAELAAACGIPWQAPSPSEVSPYLDWVVADTAARSPASPRPLAGRALAPAGAAPRFPPADLEQS
jgi:amino acid adenylation domain-containing protein/thioester reductase-like protein